MGKIYLFKNSYKEVFKTRENYKWLYNNKNNAALYLQRVSKCSTIPHPTYLSDLK